MFSIHLLLNLLILVRVDVGWSPSQDSLGEKQWNIVEREATPILTQTVTPTFTPSSSSEFPIHLTHIYAPRGKPTVATCKLYREKEPVSFDLNQTQKVCFCCKSTVLMCSNFKEAANNHCYGKSMSTSKCSNTIYGIWLEQSNTCQSKPNLFLISLIRTYVIWCTLAVMRVVLK